MIDVVYPLANLSKHRDDWELRYSLRSLQQQNWVGNIYLIGHCPKWAEDVIHLPCPDPYVSCKDANLINKILYACSSPTLSQEFLVNSDDQYILQPIGEEDLEPMLENPNRLSEFTMRASINSWFKRVTDTVRWCKEHGYPQWIFQSHTPYLVRKNEYAKVMCQVPWARGPGFTTHIYLNMTLEHSPEKEPVGRTVRVKGRISDMDLRRMVKSAIFFNHNDGGLQSFVKTFLEEHFPVPSKWERS